MFLSHKIFCKAYSLDRTFVYIHLKVNLQKW